MDRKTDLRNMDASGVGSGKCACDTMLAPKGLAEYPLPNEKGSNTLEEYTTEKLPLNELGGKARH